MDPNSLPLPSNLPSAESWRADLDTWEDKFVLVDPSGLVFFENKKREYAVSPIPWIKHSTRCAVTSDNTACSGRPSELLRRKSCPVPQTLVGKVPKAEPLHSAQVDSDGSVLSAEPLKQAKRRRIEERSVDEVASGVKTGRPSPSVTAGIATSHFKRLGKIKIDWKRFKKDPAKGTVPATPLSQLSRKRKSDASDNKLMESPRGKTHLPPEASLVCSVCSRPTLKKNWPCRRFGKPVCQPCGKFFENNFIYTFSKQPPVCATGLHNCSVSYVDHFPCRLCRLKKCIEVCSPEKIALQKFANANAKKYWLSQRKHLLEACGNGPSKEAVVSSVLENSQSQSSPKKSPTKPAESTRKQRGGCSSPVKDNVAGIDDSGKLRCRMTRSRKASEGGAAIETEEKKECDSVSVASSGKDFADGPSLPLTKFEMGDFVIERPPSPALVVEVTTPVSQESASNEIMISPDDHVVEVPAESVKTELELPLCAAPKPRAAALAACTAIRTVTRSRSSPDKKKQEPAPILPSPPKKQRRTVGSLPQISVSSLKSVKPITNKRRGPKQITPIRNKRRTPKQVTPPITNRRRTTPVADKKTAKKITPRRSADDSGRKSLLDSPEYVPRLTDDLKASQTSLNSDNSTNEKKPRIKHVFRPGSSTFLSRNNSGTNLASSSSPPVASSGSKVTAAPTSKKPKHRSPTPPPPLHAPIRVSFNKGVLASQSGKTNEIGKKPRRNNSTGIVSPTKLQASRCNKCGGCRQIDCGRCRFCHDMPKFGGPGRQQQACEKRVCEYQPLRLQDFSYRRIKLPTIQVPHVSAPVTAVKEPTSVGESENMVKSQDSPTKQAEPVDIAKAILSTPELTASPDSSTEHPRRSSLCSTGPNCGSPGAISGAISALQSPEESTAQQVDKTSESKVSITSEKDDTVVQEIVDVSRLKPVLSEFEPFEPLPHNSEPRRRRVCAAILEDVSLERCIAEGIAIVTTASPAIRALCLLCGSAGHEQMIFCQLCAHPFHTFCLTLLDEDSKETLDLSSIDLANWLCPRCQYCELCHQSSTPNNKIALCSRCKHHFHPACLAPSYRVPTKTTRSVWACSHCVRCELCGATHPGRGGQWSPDFKFCQACYDVRCKNYCPECNETYSPDDYTLRMLQCHKCDFWVHASPCATMTDDLYDLFEFLPNSVRFVCLKCAKKVSLSRPMIWEVRVQRLLADRLGEALGLFLQHIQKISAAGAEQAMETEDAVQCQLASAAMDADEQKDIINNFCEMFVKASYRDISTFILDFWNVLKINSVSLGWLTDFFLNAIPEMSDEFKQRVRTTTLAKGQGRLDTRNKGSFRAEKKSKKEKTEKEKEKEKEKKPEHRQNAIFLRNASLVNQISDDARMCRLCWRFGDSDTHAAGRLLYVGQDDWVHVNCALWSAEVFERGSQLCNVTQALARSRHLKCVYCGRTGATLQCTEPGCRLDFHFMCARENDHAFTEDHRCYCSAHVVEEDSDDEDEVGYISDFSVDRRLICDPDSIRWRRSWLDGFSSQDLTVVIGSVTVLRLGVIYDLSDLKHVLIPLHYEVERVHWDVDNPTRLRIYRCTVGAVQSPNIENLNSAATTIAFKTPVKYDDVEDQKKASPDRVEDQIIPAVSEPPLPQPTPSPVVEPAKKNLHFDIEPLVKWSGNKLTPMGNMALHSVLANACEKNKEVAAITKPVSLEKPVKSPSRPAMDAAALNRFRRMIDASPVGPQNNVSLMRSVQNVTTSSVSPSPSKRVMTPSSPIISRMVPFAHLKPSSPSPTRRFASPTKVVRPNLPPSEEKRPEKSIILKPEKTGCSVFVPMPDGDVLSLTDHMVSRVAFENGDFSRHGASLLPHYSSPTETTLHVLRTAAGISGKRVPTKASNSRFVTTMWQKYKTRVKSAFPNNGPKPVVGNVQTTSGALPIILNHNRMPVNSVRPPEMDLFPVSLFGVPAFGDRRRRHMKVIKEVEAALKAETEAKQNEETSKTLPATPPKLACPEQKPITFQLVNKTTSSAKIISSTSQVTNVAAKPVSVARLSLVSQGPHGARVWTIRNATATKIEPVQPIVVPAQSRPQLTSAPDDVPVRASVLPKSSAPQKPAPVAAILTSPPSQKIMVSALATSAPISRLSLGQPVRTLSGLISCIGPNLPVSLQSPPRMQPSASQPTVQHFPTVVPLGSISPVMQHRYARMPSVESISPVPKLSFSSVSSMGSPPAVNFSDLQLTLGSPVSSIKHSPRKGSLPVNSRLTLPSLSVPASSDEAVAAKTKKKVPHKRKEGAQTRRLDGDSLGSSAPKKMKHPKEPKKQIIQFAPRPKTPLSLATLLPKSPLKACLPTTELALAEMINRVVTESASGEGIASKAKVPIRRQKQQRYLVFEISPTEDSKSENTWTIRGFTWQDSWRVFFSRLSAAREAKGFTALGYDSISGLSLLGLMHNSVTALIEQLPGVEEESSAYSFRFARYERIAPNPSGCARAQPWIRSWTPGQRRHRDVFCFLLSNYRKPRLRRAADGDQDQTAVAGAGGLVSWEVSRPHKVVRRPTTMVDLPLPTRLRYLKETARFDVGVFRSAIHARGLYALRDFEAQEMIIEYAGEVIRATLTDKRERMYERQGIGCYMFRLDDTTVIDATRCGNAGRFINHCCEPNCYSRVIVGYEGLKHIVIFALRPIAAGEELTYDYKFPLEDAASKIPCYCGARRCRKYLN